MDVPGRILAVDPGTKRIGYAISDDLRVTVRPLEVWTRRGLELDLKHLETLLKQYEVVEVVVGMPYRLDGSESPSTERARSLLESIRSTWPELRVREYDEALTTWAAEQQLTAEGVPPKARKSKVDAYAAAALLEAFLRQLDEDRA